MNERMNEDWDFNDVPASIRKNWEKKSPILRVPGSSQRLYWEREIGRWVDYRVPVPGIAIDIKTSNN